MFAQGYRQFAAVVAEAAALSGEEGLRVMAHRAMAFMVEEPARYQLLFHRTIPGFTPSPGPTRCRSTCWNAPGRGSPATASAPRRRLTCSRLLLGGLAGQQIANDPGGDHWVRLVDTAVDMFLTHIKAAGRTARPARERTRS